MWFSLLNTERGREREREESSVEEVNNASSSDKQSKNLFDKMSAADILAKEGLSLVQFFLRRLET